ncbi:MAG TPA: putative 2OG-Fe(II) oxygenase [Povalibacter sp.]|nr:putative 2OG-Fe(II) oxygenase [Povalibacter sp.]
MRPVDPATLELAETLTADAIQLFRAGAVERALYALRDTERSFPFFTPAITWQIPMLDALGEFQEVRKLYDFRNSVLILDADSGDDEKMTDLAHALSVTITRKVTFKSGTTRMPLLKASVSSDLTGLRDPAIARFRTLLMHGFRRYLRQATFRNRHVAQVDDCWLSFWSTQTRRHGSIGPHFHARSWISCVFYPGVRARTGSRICVGGDLELGHVPALMGNLRRPCLLRIRPQPGRLVLFPSYIGHAVTPVRSMQSRISLAGDLGLTPGRAADRAARQ